MPTRTADLRTTIGTMEQAEAAMQEISRIECEDAYSRAHMEKQVQRARERHVQRMADKAARLSELTAALTRFIDANRDQFQKPRKHVTEFGSFGLQTATEVEIMDEDACVAALMDKGYDDCMKVVRKLVKPKIKERLKDGETIPGTVLRTGDTAIYKVAAELLRDAKEKAAR